MPQDPNTTKGGLWARLRGAFGPVAAADPAPGEVMPTFDNIPEATPASVPVAMPVPAAEVPQGDIPEAVPMADPVAETPLAETPPAAPPRARDEAETTDLCSYCQTPRVGDAQFCFDCGMMYPEGQSTANALHSSAVAKDRPTTPSGRLADRYELKEQVGVRGGVTRWRGIDHGQGDAPVEVTLVRMPHLPPSDNTMVVKSGAPSEAGHDDLHADIQPPTSEPATSSFSRLPAELSLDWPGMGWEWSVLSKVCHPCVPRVLDHFPEADFYYLVEEAFTGPLLWDAWEDPALTPVQRFNALAQMAEGLKALHDAGAILEGLRPDIVVVTAHGQAGLRDLTDLLPLPVPADAPVQAGAYTAPELVLDREHADARADLYSFGAMLYALYVGRELTDMDFVRQGVPKPFVERDPDAHPALARVIMKTFVREKEGRFPTDEAVKEDPSGFTELARVLRAVGRSMAQARLDVASWTTTGKVRTGNEDGFALLHATGSRQEEMGERALVILADGMGGAEAGEVASAMAIEHLRGLLLKERLFASLTGAAAEPAEFDVLACQDLFVQALNDTNKHIFNASRTPGVGKRGMGCTAEVLYVDGQRFVVGHVGDSRTYHYAGGRLTQVTRDQTLVNRLVELGHLTPEEAENHPRKNELQQALGGQPFVEPAAYHAPVRPGDWVLVCSDGLTNHVDHATLTEMVQRADSAEMLARRLCNLANLQGGSDNCTIIAIRAT